VARKKPDKQAATRIGRDARGRLLPGHSGNPRGRPPGPHSLSERLREALRENDGYMARWVLAALVHMAITKPEAQKIIWDRVEGKVPQPIIGEGGGPLEFTIRIEKANDNEA